MNDRLETARFLLRPAEDRDLHEMMRIYGDAETMHFVPLFPARDMADMEKIFAECWIPTQYEKRYLICEKESGEIVGYVGLELRGAHDLGYGVRRDLWHTGVATEAAAAVLEEAREMGIPFVTATHDRENPNSGGVMRKLGMTYRYSYREQWMPKDISVVFRMYQIDLQEGQKTYEGYRERFPEHFTEEIQ